MGVLLKIQDCEEVHLYSHVTACLFQLSSGLYLFSCQSPHWFMHLMIIFSGNGVGLCCPPSSYLFLDLSSFHKAV